MNQIRPVITFFLLLPIFCQGQNTSYFIGLPDIQLYKSNSHIKIYPDSFRIGDFNNDKYNVLPLTFGITNLGKNKRIFFSSTYIHTRSFSTSKRSYQNGYTGNFKTRTRSNLVGIRYGYRFTKLANDKFNIKLSTAIGGNASKFKIWFYDEYDLDGTEEAIIDASEQLPMTFNVFLESGLLFNTQVYKKLGIGLEFTYRANAYFRNGRSTATQTAELFDGTKWIIESIDFGIDNQQLQLSFQPNLNFFINYNL